MGFGRGRDPEAAPNPWRTHTHTHPKNQPTAEHNSRNSAAQGRNFKRLLEGGRRRGLFARGRIRGEIKLPLLKGRRSRGAKAADQRSQARTDSGTAGGVTPPPNTLAQCRHSLRQGWLVERGRLRALLATHPQLPATYRSNRAYALVLNDPRAPPPPTCFRRGGGRPYHSARWRCSQTRRSRRPLRRQGPTKKTSGLRPPAGLRSRYLPCNPPPFIQPASLADACCNLRKAPPPWATGPRAGDIHREGLSDHPRVSFLYPTPTRGWTWEHPCTEDSRLPAHGPSPKQVGL